MIKSLRSNKESFKAVHFDSGFNVILADKTKLSTEKDSRNGLGKSTLIEIIHFCLGSSTSGTGGLQSEELEGWIFTLDLTLRGKDYSASRDTAEPSKIWLEGDFSDWPIQPETDQKRGGKFMSNADWCRMLGLFMFGLSREITEKSYSPRFRGLISYFVRRGVEAFANPFRHFSQQPEWDKQVYNAYLLGLNWEYAGIFQIFRDKEKTLETLKSASEKGLLADFVGSIGTLEGERIALVEEIRGFEEQIKTFKVHPQYYEIQQRADRATEEIHKLINERTVNASVLRSYQKSLEEEKDASQKEVVAVYKEAGLSFPQATEKKLEEIIDFHKQVVRNRRTYLKSEIEKISRDIESAAATIEKLSTQRAAFFETLNTHGALDEYSNLQQQLNKLRQRMEDIDTKLGNLKRFEEGTESLDIERKELIQKMKQDKDERREIIETDIKLFNQNSKFLYDEPGVLSIDIGQGGYRFGVEIKRAKSQGFSYMKVFCYDLMLLQRRNGSLSDMPGFLIHDSTIFDGVDERQIAKALELASQEAEERGFQYICTLNSDMIPTASFSPEFSKKFDDSIKLRLSDASEDGGLLGIRF